MFRFSVTVLTALSIGFHWTLLQCVAWVGMAIAYTGEDGSLVSGLSRTFDGQHPCSLCKAVESGVRSEQEQKSPTLPVSELVKTKLVFTLQTEAAITVVELPGRSTPRPDYSGDWPRASASQPLDAPPRVV
ncbi:MAG: hypothetical protein KDN22_13075 [Verrucomicrobiae bacterium]|nr:hypothetical protein [Verrucomicrobiae bacterium]